MECIQERETDIAVVICGPANSTDGVSVAVLGPTSSKSKKNGAYCKQRHSRAKKVAWTFWHSLGFASLGGDGGLNSKEEHVMWCGVKRGG
jgi:hypothetical protein